MSLCCGARARTRLKIPSQAIPSSFTSKIFIVFFSFSYKKGKPARVSLCPLSSNGMDPRPCVLRRFPSSDWPLFLCSVPPVYYSNNKKRGLPRFLCCLPGIDPMGRRPSRKHLQNTLGRPQPDLAVCLLGFPACMGQQKYMGILPKRAVCGQRLCFKNVQPADE